MILSICKRIALNIHISCHVQYSSISIQALLAQLSALALAFKEKVLANFGDGFGII